MPTIRKYACSDCGYQLEVILTADQLDTEAPCCPRCLDRQPTEAAVAIRHPEKTSNRRGAISPVTKAVFRAIGAVLYGENRSQLPRDGRALAQLLADRAQELGLDGCDQIDPAAKLTTEAVRAALEGMSAADREAAPS